MSEKVLAISYKNCPIHFNEDRLVSLTDMWRASGSPANQDPSQWVRGAGRGFIEDLTTHLNMGKSHVIKAQRGKGVAGTWAHWQIALAYAKYLSHEFHRFVNDAFREWAQERTQPQASHPQLPATSSQLEQIVQALPRLLEQFKQVHRFQKEQQSAQAAAELRLEAAEVKLNVIQGLGLARQAGWQTLMSFARLRGIVFEGNQAQLEGKNASEIAKSMALELGRQLEGSEAGNRTYPPEVLACWLSGYLARVHQQKRGRELNIFAG